MLFQEELVALVLSNAGQVFIDPRTLHFTDDYVRRNFMEPCAAEFQAFRPPTVWEHIWIPVEGWKLPKKVRRVNGLRALWLYVWQYEAGIALRPVPRMEAQKWFIADPNGARILYAPPGRYEVEYISNEGYTITHEVDFHEVYEPHPAETLIEFNLRVKIRPGTLVLRTGGHESEAGWEGYAEAKDDGSGAITGDFVDQGFIDYTTSRVTLRLNAALPDVVKASFYGVNPGVKELDLREVYFIDLFAARFLPAFAAARAIASLPDLPVDLNKDDLLTYARQKQEFWQQVKTERQKWWAW